MLPDFLIIGVQKGATTWLANMLGKHPDVFIPEQKEIHFFEQYYEKGIDWYIQHFKEAAQQKAVGEATPGYLYFEQVPGRIMETLGGDIKFFVTLRNPVDRAYSAFWMFFSRGAIPENMDFLTSYRKDIHGIRSRGFYYEQLNRYLKLFPEKNFHILISEESRMNGLEAVNSCLKFLDLTLQQRLARVNKRKANQGIDVSIFNTQIWKIRNILKLLPYRIEKPIADFGAKILDRLPKKRQYNPISAKLKKELVEDFLPDIKKLEDLLQKDLSIWYR